VTDLRLELAWADSGFRNSLHEASIAGISRLPVTNQKICLDRQYYRWRIDTNFPPAGTITFGASGFTQTLRADPVLVEEQKLSPAQRAGFGKTGERGKRGHSTFCP
jgi:hypothetical protein